MNENVIEVEALRKQYGAFTAVDGISFDIRRGETFALLGPNGAGKSTTIEILEGYRRRTSGDVRVLGVDPQRGGPDWKARLGVVLQNDVSGEVVFEQGVQGSFDGLVGLAEVEERVVAGVVVAGEVEDGGFGSGLGAKAGLLALATPSGDLAHDVLVPAG